MAAKSKKGEVKSPALTQKQQIANCGGMPVTKDVKAIEKANTPPKTPPSSGTSVSVRQ